MNLTIYPAITQIGRKGIKAFDSAVIPYRDMALVEIVKYSAKFEPLTRLKNIHGIYFFKSRDFTYQNLVSFADWENPPRPFMTPATTHYGIWPISVHEIGSKRWMVVQVEHYSTTQNILFEQMSGNDYYLIDRYHQNPNAIIGLHPQYGEIWLAEERDGKFEMDRCIFRHWQSKFDTCKKTATDEPTQQPMGIKGLCAVDTVEMDPTTIKVFYTRKIDFRNLHWNPEWYQWLGYPPRLNNAIEPNFENAITYLSDNLCFGIVEFKENGEFIKSKKYRSREGETARKIWDFDPEPFDGFDTSLLPLPASYGGISFLEKFNKWIYTAHIGFPGTLRVFESEDLIEWKHVKDFSNVICHYPKLYSYRFGDKAIDGVFAYLVSAFPCYQPGVSNLAIRRVLIEE